MSWLDADATAPAAAAEDDDDASPHSICRDVFGYDKIDRPGCGCCPGQSRGKPLLLRPEAGGTKAKIRPSEENDRPLNKTTTPSPAEVSISNEEESSVDFDPTSTTLALGKFALKRKATCTSTCMHLPHLSYLLH